MTARSIFAERYVSLTTFRRDGTAVSCPVWIVELGGGTGGISTDRANAKVRRILADGRATLRPCNSKGAVAEGSDEVSVTIRLGTNGELAAVERAVRAKYRIGVILFAVSERFNKLRGAGRDRVGCALIVSQDLTPVQ